MFPIVKYLTRREKIKFLHMREITAIGKSFIQNRIKNRNIFLHTSIKVSENFSNEHLRWNKTNLSKLATTTTKKGL